MTQARTLNNRYELQSKIGDGGMAAVYKALDLRLNRMVAVKILRDSYSADPQFLERFKREAQQAASLNHPNIVRVFDVGDDGDYHYIVMEYVEGSSLKDKIVREGPFPTQEALEIGAEISDAIGYAHANGLIHRDIKPQNILMDKHGRAKVTDFGIAKSVNAATLTEAGITLGTVHYFSPEQAKGLQVLPQSDIYSIGVVLFEMLTGQIPFDSDNPVALALKHIEEPVPSLRRLNPSIPPVVEQIVLRTLAKDPQRRYRSADELAHALRNVEAQAEQGTRAVRPPVVPPTTNIPRTGNGRGPVPPPAYTNYNNTSEEATRFQPVRPVQPPPVYPAYDQPQPYDQRGQRSGVRYYPERPSQAYRGRPPVQEPVEDYEDEPRRGGGCVPWLLGGAAFLMITALIVAAVLILPSLTSNTTKPTNTPGPTLPSTTPAQVAKVAVPDVKNKNQDDAQNALIAAKLQLGNVTQENSDLDANKVIRTDPATGAQVDVNTKINLVVSKGKEQVQLNDYTNVGVDGATKQLQDLGFKVQRVDENNDTFQPGAVIRTEPKGGQAVAKGSLIKLVVSKGPQPTATPIPATATPMPPTPTPLPPNTPVPTAKPVPVTVPSVVGEQRTDGEKALRAAGFTTRVEEWDENDVRSHFSGAALEQALQTYNGLKKGAILGTNPPGGQQADKGSEIFVAVKK